MKQPLLISNSAGGSVADELIKLSTTADEIRLAVAYFSDSELLDEWLDRKLKLTILVALQYPTDPALLKKLLPLPPSKVEIKFYDSNFHSKLYIFCKKGTPFAAVVGSSNFTSGGLGSNLETNICISDQSQLSVLLDHFTEMWRPSASLSPEDVQRYEKFCKRTKKLRNSLRNKDKHYDGKHVRPRLSGRRARTVKEAKDYFVFWKYADEVINIIKPVSGKEWPSVRTYLTVDHFWHWLYVEWDRADLTHIRKDHNYRRRILPSLFKQYAIHDKGGSNSTIGMKARAKRLYTLLNQTNIGRLRRSQAREIYSSLNSGGMRSLRFAGDELFATDNPLERLRRSLGYLLWSSDDVDQRISALLRDPKYKLNHFGKSNIQELLGWVRSDLPLRNSKANNAVKLLGYKFN